MCIQDIRIGRNTKLRRRAVEAPAATTQLEANPSRVALVVSYRGAGASPADVISIHSGAAYTDPPLGAIGAGQPSKIFRVEEYGQALTGAIFLNGGSTALNWGWQELVYDDVDYPHSVTIGGNVPVPRKDGL